MVNIMTAHSDSNGDGVKRVQNAAFDAEDSQVDQWDGAEPLTAEQAAQWRSTHWQPSPWKVVQWQAIVSVVVGLVIWGVSRDSAAIISWLYGALAIWLPACMFAKVVVSQPELGVLVMFEMLKLLLNVVLLAIAPLLLDKVAWGYLLGAVVITVNMYWIAPIWMARCRRV